MGYMYMKTNRTLITVLFMFLNFIPLNAFAQQGPRMLSNNRSLRILEAGKSYSMVEFTPQMPLKIEVQGSGKLTVYIKTAVSQRYSGLPAFRLFIKRDGHITNQYMFPKKTRSNSLFEGIKNYNPSAEINSIPIDVPEGVHTYEIYLSQSPYIVGLASFGYMQLAVRHISMAREKSISHITRTESYGHGYKKEYAKSLYLQPYGIAGAVYEQGTNNDFVYAGVGVNVDVFITRKFAISGMINYMDADQEYHIWRNLPFPFGVGMYIVNEQTLLVHALLSYGFLHTDKNTLMFGAGWGDLELINDILPGEVNGPVVSALLKLGLSESTSLSIRPSYMQDVFNTSVSPNSILDTPYSLLLYPVGLVFNLSSGISAEIGYDGWKIAYIPGQEQVL